MFKKRKASSTYMYICIYIYIYLSIYLPIYLYIQSIMQTHLGCTGCFPSAILFSCHGHTTQSPFLQKHCQMYQSHPS